MLNHTLSDISYTTHEKASTFELTTDMSSYNLHFVFSSFEGKRLLLLAKVQHDRGTRASRSQIDIGIM